MKLDGARGGKESRTFSNHQKSKWLKSVIDSELSRPLSQSKITTDEIKRLEREQRMEYRRFDTHLTAIRNASRSSANRKKKKSKKSSNDDGPLQTQSRRLKELEVCSFFHFSLQDIHHSPSLLISLFCCASEIDTETPLKDSSNYKNLVRSYNHVLIILLLNGLVKSTTNSMNVFDVIFNNNTMNEYNTHGVVHTNLPNSIQYDFAMIFLTSKNITKRFFEKIQHLRE